MTAKTALSTVVLWGLAFAVLGAVIGGGLGLVAPQYYRSVLRDGRAPEFDPFQVGLGLGATQGLAAGVAVSLGVLTMLAWRDLRLQIAASGEHASQPRPIRPAPARFFLWGAGTVMLVVIFSLVAFVYGGIVGQQQLYQSWTDRKLRRVARVLETRDFPHVQAEYSSAAQVYLVGAVRDDAARTVLRDRLILAFGTEEADDMMRLVTVAE